MKFLRLAAAGCVALASFAVDASRRRPVVVAVAPVELGEQEFGDPDALPLVSQTVRIEIDGQHARTISNLQHDNLLDGRLEGLTTLQLAETARITAFSYWNGADRILGEVLPKQTARQIYEETVGRRRDPGLLEQIGPGRFTLHVFPIEPRERKRMQLIWDEWLSQHDGQVSYRAPVSATAEIVVDFADARAVSEIRSSSHVLETHSENGRTRVTAHARNESVDELSMTWHRTAPPLAIRSWIHRDEGEDAYVLFHVAAPPVSTSEAVPKDVTLVLDESGSMAGAPLNHGKAAAREIIEHLDAADRVNVVLFDDRVETLFDRPRAVTAEVRETARRFIDGAGNGGGTDVALALTAALRAQGKGPRPKTVLLLTDGESPREPAFAAVERDVNDVRLFTVGFGKQVDTAALQRLAQLKRGHYTAIVGANQIQPTMARLYDRMRAPVLVGLSIDSTGPTLVRTYPATLPDLFAGDEIVIVARVQGGGEIDVRLQGTTSSGEKTLKHRTTVPSIIDRPWVGSMWATSRIDDLLNRLQLDNTDRDERIAEVTRLGVAYDIVTPYTSFLAIPESELTANTRELLRRGRLGQDTNTGRVVDMEEFRNIPVGDSSSRDFTSVIESAPGMEVDEAPDLTSRRAEGISYARKSKSSSAPDGASTGGARAGCAHCNVDDSGGGPLWLMLVLLLGRAPRRRPR